MPWLVLRKRSRAAESLTAHRDSATPRHPARRGPYRAGVSAGGKGSIATESLTAYRDQAAPRHPAAGEPLQRLGKFRNGFRRGPWVRLRSRCRAGDGVLWPRSGSGPRDPFPSPPPCCQSVASTGGVRGSARLPRHRIGSPSSLRRMTALGRGEKEPKKYNTSP